ncbi:unnamed protein product (macronuclear) [Paramecium tetraurelia]|uniref:NEDD8-activating enzyme E1 catalytic subunit n=1 Tax=Paramecium tetraurelia TaxID=5888 RepID=A0DLZ0_PARTE|nr:uncharacterized protein GSPATT00018275001 [Paramecium tetraurelia]CAK84057.1 unnamed protein product [Paramecium tetraurelia]|eukprot:XP_001451454.1 hypothetical protein (macronuclear) [Paramecium tetraurelia strain d4-2]
MNSILNTFSPLSKDLYNEYRGQVMIEALATQKVLVIGAGGLGCEILKTLALSGIKEIHVIDLDTIDLTNLNRQFLFRMKDVGKYKAEVAAEFIMKRIPTCKVIPYTKKIQEFPISFYSEFPVIIAGLDNVEARRWINRVVIQMVQRDENDKVIDDTRHYLIDGGTEGLNGQARVISPFETACYECTLSQLPKQLQYQMCTIASTPRLPEHCIAYAYEVLWSKEQPNVKLDKDNFDHMNWIYQKALERSKQFNIEGVTYKLTLGVVKNIIPAVASTNALIASICTVECFKILTGNGSQLNNYIQWYGQNHQTGVGINVIQQERLEECTECSIQTLEILVKRTDKISVLLTQLPPDIELCSKGQTLITNNIRRKQGFDHILEKTFQELIDEQLIDVQTALKAFDKNKTINVRINYE